MALSSEVLQPVADAYINADYSALKDPIEALYPDTGAEYARGIQQRNDSYVVQQQINEDDGTDTLGLEDSTGLYAKAELLNPIFSSSRQALQRFLRVLGYRYEDINAIFQPQIWSNRTLSISDFPQVQPGAGYALSTAEWPIEFNTPSAVICGDHTWEYAGYLNYTKGLPEYQTSSLSAALRFDSIETSVWGGTASFFGNTELGELVLYGLDVVGGSGQALFL